MRAPVVIPPRSRVAVRLAEPKRFNVLGFDPGLSAAGLGLINATGLVCLRAWTVRTATTQCIEDRMGQIAHVLQEGLADADLLAIEDQHNTFFAMLRAGASNASAGRLAQVVGLAQGIAAERSIPVVFVTPQILRVRLGLGGNAKKAQVSRAIHTQVRGITKGVSNHAVDAVAIALAGARQWHGHLVKMRSVGKVLEARR